MKPIHRLAIALFPLITLAAGTHARTAVGLVASVTRGLFVAVSTARQGRSGGEEHQESKGSFHTVYPSTRFNTLFTALLSELESWTCALLKLA